MKTLQQIFDAVATHLLKQNRQAKDGLSCCYRGIENTKCAVGCLIDDANYHPDMEGYTVEDITYLLQEYGANVNGVEIPADYHSSHMLFNALLANKVNCEAPGVLALLDSLQGCHDSYPPSQWEVELQSIANSNGLTFNHVQA